MQKKLHSGCLNAAAIDAMSETLIRLLEPMKLESKEILRIRLCVENVMGIWAEELGDNTECRLMQSQHFGKTTLYLQADGKSVDPTQYQDDLLLSVSSNPNMVVGLGLPAEYRYCGGRNELRLHLPEKKKSPIRQVVIAMVLAILLGVGLRWLVPDFSVLLAEKLISPLMTTITNVLSMIAGPLVFLSIVSGITGIGDAASFGRIGGMLAKRFFLITVLLSTFAWLSVSWLFPITLTGAAKGESAFYKLFEMILDIIPKDIVSPFLSGNAMQIIFLAGCVGLCTIFLNDEVMETVKIVNQFNTIIQQLMSWISRLLPTFIFLSMLNLIFTSNLTELSQLLFPLLLIATLCLLMPLLYGIYASLRTGIPLGYMLKSELPTFLLAITTASSAAAFGINVECCEKKLGIDSQLIKFGIPFGQVLFMPGAAVIFIILSLCMAKWNQIAITPAWIVTLILISSILAVATPPIPGGALSSVMILFSQLGIPGSCVVLCATVLTFADYLATACDLVCLQQELLVNARKLDLLKAQTGKN